MNIAWTKRDFMPAGMIYISLRNMNLYWSSSVILIFFSLFSSFVFFLHSLSVAVYSQAEEKDREREKKIATTRAWNILNQANFAVMVGIFFSISNEFI